MRHLRFIVLFVVLILFTTLTHAQQAEAPVTSPTALALMTATIPVRDRVDLAKRLLGVTEIAPPPSPTDWQVGDVQTFTVINSTENAVFQVDAALEAKGEHILLWVEQGANINREQIRQLADAFDMTIYDAVRGLWGSEATPGIDGDPRIYGLFTHGLGAGTAAYFASDHMYPVEAVPTSNEHEMFFFNLDALGAQFDRRVVESVIAHEFQHMIRANVQYNEDYWLNEGYSEFTQLHFYDLPAWEIAMFMGMPGTQLNAWAEDILMRTQNYGAALLFVTYFYDRYGLDALQQLSADPSTRGLDAFDSVLWSMGEPGVNDFFADWVLANLLFDTSIGDGRYGYHSIPTNYVGVATADVVTEYPYQRRAVVNQYGAQYIVLTNLDGASALDIGFDAPLVVGLLPTSAFSGQRMWYSNRHDMSDTTLTRAFDLSDVTRATLTYRLWHHIELYWDYGYVMVSIDGGATWTPLVGEHTTADNPHSVAYGAGYTGRSNPSEAGSARWVKETVSLDDYVGGEVLVRFEMVTDDGITQPGMAIDDVRIPEIGYDSDFEADDGGWDAQGWVLIDNLLPQSVWVQAVQHIGDDAVVTRWLNPARESLTLEPGVDQVTLVVSPFAPVTTVPMAYTLDVTVR